MTEDKDYSYENCIEGRLRKLLKFLSGAKYEVIHDHIPGSVYGGGELRG